MNSKRGSVMVEASLIIPIIISIIMSMIYINMELYQNVEQNCGLHNTLLEVANENSAVGNYIRRIDFLKGLFE